MAIEASALRQELRTGLEQMYGARLRGVYVFGSYARGEAASDSDIDVLIVLDDFERYGTEIERVSYLSSELSLKFETTINVVLAREQDWLKADTPFLRNVRKEAVAA